MKKYSVPVQLTRRLTGSGYVNLILTIIVRSNGVQNLAANIASKGKSLLLIWKSIAYAASTSALHATKVLISRATVKQQRNGTSKVKQRVKT